MKITRIEPTPPPPEFKLVLTRDEGWALAAALKDYADRRPAAVSRNEWLKWSAQLYNELRK